MRKIIAEVCATSLAGIEPFEIAFDKTMNFGGGDKLVLTEGVIGEGIRNFRRILQQQFAMHSCRPDFTVGNRPHATLFYRTHLIAEKNVEPVSWQAGHLALIQSPTQGESHRVLESWDF